MCVCVCLFYRALFQWALSSRQGGLLKIAGLFCKTSSLLLGSFAKETCNFKTWRLLKIASKSELRHASSSESLSLCEAPQVSLSRLLQIVGLLCRISSLLWGSFAKETCNSKEPTSRNHPILDWLQKRTLLVRNTACCSAARSFSKENNCCIESTCY